MRAAGVRAAQGTSRGCGTGGSGAPVQGTRVLGNGVLECRDMAYWGNRSPQCQAMGWGAPVTPGGGTRGPTRTARSEDNGSGDRARSGRG